MLLPVIGRVEKTVLDCADPQALAAFYARLLGFRVNEDDGHWQKDPAAPHRSQARVGPLQRGRPYAPPQWPDPQRPQQEHLDIRVDDVDAAEREVLAAGATRLPNDHEGGFRVFADPAGHPFCLAYG
jgi:catechol 2,3-dioxygenase-like lactoylglutathione lyase family enzyme